MCCCACEGNLAWVCTPSSCKQQGNTVIFACIVAMVKVDSHGDYYWMIRKMLAPSIVFVQIPFSSDIGGLWLSFI